MSEFRDYIVSMLSRTAFAKRHFSEEKLEMISERLGVRIETLLEARLLYRERSTAIGSATGRLEEYHARRKNANSDYAAITLHLQQPAKEVVQRYAESRGINIPTLVRSILHHYLLGSWEPSQLHNSWFLPGLPAKYQKGSYSKRTVINSSVTPAVREAFWMRAETLQSNIEELGRTLLIETVKGNFGRPGVLTVVTRKQLYTDINRYQVRFEEDPVQVPKHLDFGGDEEDF